MVQVSQPEKGKISWCAIGFYVCTMYKNYTSFWLLL